MTQYADSTLQEKGLPCWSCQSSDAVARYLDSDGMRERLHCFSCNSTKFIDGGTYVRPKETRRVTAANIQEVIDSGQIRALPSRHLTQASCEKWGYAVRNTTAGWQQLAVYRDAHGTAIGVKIRPENKDDMFWVGSSKDILYGRWLWGSGGKKVVITEGELDAISVSQAQDHQWPVVSIPNGAAHAAKAIAANIEWLCTFDYVCIGFDMDAKGRAACLEAAALLPPGKAFIIKWTRKDANEMLVKGEQAAITKCIWQAEAYRPDGILDARTLTAQCLIPPTMGTPWPYAEMTNWTLGRRGGELYTFGAGFGLGKSDYLAEVISCTLLGETRDAQPRFAPEGFAVFGFEAGAAVAKVQIAGKIARRRFQFPQGHPDCMWSPEELVAVMDKMDQSVWGQGGKLFILDNKGAADWERGKDLARFLHHAEGVTNFLWDPIGALVVDEDDERRFLDRMVLEAAHLAEELHSKVYLVSHLTRPKEGPSHEEGGQVRGSQFRGANGIGMYSNFVFGLERNQQAETEVERCTTTLRAVKDRLTGNSAGKTLRLFYDRISGTLDPAQEEVVPWMTDEDRELI